MSQVTSQYLQNCLEIATEAALAASAVLLKYWGKLATVEEKGRSGDLVTIADKESEAVILEIIRRNFPNHSILAEESGQFTSNQSEYLWAIDPLDGTTNYAHQYPFFSTSIGLLIDGVPQVGVIYDPIRDQLFRAATGLGATCDRATTPQGDRHPIHVSPTKTLDRSLLVTGFAYDRRETPDNNYAEFCYLTHLTQGVRRSGAASLDLAYVADGRLDGYWERGLSPWDLAAGVILVTEAGGKVTAYDQTPFAIDTGRIMATNTLIHEELSSALLRIAPHKLDKFFSNIS
ncbi:inositol monophosphatase family protein [Merismopedia glauca]|uniref:Inositol-1-monophosphatase n=1 Tax=Merismopedia glauca CCAP 1448/3 TaxID=1296344 RepID=A0A2T1C3P8_9CYAN|nr:inositol monophosphatase family protein [Merismopedia glauca]PSB02902.1 inositol monophosphatase [Merismopedia glauca CCAP 1448/3]